jgi:hypothetical protein
MIINWRLTIVVVICTSMNACDAMLSKTYQIFTGAGGGNVCAADQPSTTLMMDVTMDGRCGVQCTVSFLCSFYQFKAALGTCELFNNVPTNYTVIEGCTAYRVTSM